MQAGGELVPVPVGGKAPQRLGLVSFGSKDGGEFIVQGGILFTEGKGAFQHLDAVGEHLFPIRKQGFAPHSFLRRLSGVIEGGHLPQPAFREGMAADKIIEIQQGIPQPEVVPAGAERFGEGVKPFVLLLVVSGKHLVGGLSPEHCHLAFLADAEILGDIQLIEILPGQLTAKAVDRADPGLGQQKLLAL